MSSFIATLHRLQVTLLPASYIQAASVLLSAALLSLPAAGAAWTDEMLQAHNTVRRRVDVPPLTWSRELASVAQQWANHLIAANQFVHRNDHRYGENLFEIRGGFASPTQVVNEWASEARNYDRSSNGCSGVCGHYTQIIWRGTRQVGCGVAGNAKREVWVCNYSPPGNVVGERPY